MNLPRFKHAIRRLVLCSAITTLTSCTADNDPLLYSDREVEMRLIIRTQEQLSAFYQGREFNQAAIDKIRPALQKDGGDVILVDVSDKGVVKVQLTGACKGCPMSQMTLKDGIEKFVKSEIPEIVSVESV